MTAATANTHPRYLWHKLHRLGIGLLVCAITVFGGYASAHRYLDRRLASIVRGLDEREGGWRLEDLQRQRAALPDAENAARVVQAVAERLPDRFTQHFFLLNRGPAVADLADYSTAVKAFPTLGPRDRLTPEQARILRAAVKRTGSIAAEARGLADYRRGRFAIEHGPASSTPSPEGLGIRKVVFLLRHDALLSLHEGRFGDCLRACRAILMAGRALGDEPAPAYQLLRVECWDEALTMLDRMLGQGQAASEDLGAVQQLLEVEAAEPLASLLVRGELAYCHLRFSALEEGQMKLFASLSSPPVASMLDWLARDAIKIPHAGVLDYLGRRVAVARQPAAQQRVALRQLEKETRTDAMLGTGLGEWRSGRLLKLVQTGQIRLRAAATALAAERYRVRHGDWPDALDVLVPEFLSSVPEDPFAQAPMLYQRQPGGIVIYSVGRDGRNNQGRINIPPDAPGSDVGCRLLDVERR